MTGESGASRTIAEWVDECRSWATVLLDALKDLETANEKIRSLERENARLREDVAQLRRGATS